MQWIVFLTRSNDQEIINVLVIDPEKFISQVLDPKIQEIAKGKFHIAAYRTGEELPFYTSNKQFNPGKISNKEPFWLLKNYQMGIELKDLTIADLARDRIKKKPDISRIDGYHFAFRGMADIQKCNKADRTLPVKERFCIECFA